ncbi:MAG: hypothetical protein JW889_07785 [Verrucomicrobia bacterium]|nr:hypothetical protein [Verrucomicrobiota bacterium]
MAELDEPHADQHKEARAAAERERTELRQRQMRLQREAIRSAGIILLLVPVLVVLLFATLWPWPAWFASELPAGADAARDAWRLCWRAQRLAEGRVLPAWTAPMYYPRAGTACFDEPLVVPALISLPAYYATENAALTYNATLLAFWVLSGIGMYLFLRELGVGRMACAFGSIAFVLLPLRTAHPGDLSLHLCAGVPFALMLVTRWLRTQERRWAFLLALVVCAQGMAVVGTALALAVAVPMVMLVALARRRPTPFFDRPLYTSVGMIVLIPFVVLAAFLDPVAAHRAADERPAADQPNDDGLHPLAYLSPDEGSLVDAFALPGGAQGKSLFPGVAVLLLALAYAFFQRQMLRRVPPERRVRQTIITVLGLARLSLWLVLVVVVVGSAVSPGAWESPARLIGPMLVGLLVLTLLLAFLAWRRPRALGTALMHGLGLAALVCFILSLGAEIAPSVASPLPQAGDASQLLATLVPPARFAIVPIVFLVTAAAWILDELAAHRRFRWLPVPVLLLVCAESLVLPNAFQPGRPDEHWPLGGQVQLDPGRFTLFALPGGNVETDARWLLNSVGRFDLLVNGSSSVEPAWYRELVDTFERGDFESASALLQELWPTPYLLIDRETLPEHGHTFPLDAARIEKEWWSVFDDGRYVLYEPALKPTAPPVIRKRVRADLARTHRLLRLKARVKFADPELEPYVVVRWNGQGGDQPFALTSTFQALDFDARERWVGRPEGDVVTIALVLKQGDEFVPPTEALAARGIVDAWEVVDVEFFRVTRR